VINIYTKIKLTLLLFCVSRISPAQLSFSSLDSLLWFANKNSSTAKISSQQSLLAKWTKVAALANSVNFRNPLSFSATDNILLPVNFIPGEIFGGTEGSFRQITLGQEYVANFNFNPQIDIINPYNWAKVKSAEINKELTEVNNQISKKALHESVAAAYYNIVALQEQIIITEKSFTSSDSVTMIINNKFQLGLVREQDLNNAKVNSLNIKDKLQQLKINADQQINSLKILCDISPAVNVTIVDKQNEDVSIAKPGSLLNQKYAALQSQFTKNELRANRFSMFPVLSLVYYQGWQKNSNISFTDANTGWIQSKYIGLRLTVPFPPDVNKISQSYTSKINYRIADMNSAHAKLQNELANRTLEMDLEKSLASFEISKQILELKSNNYQKSLNQYNEGVLPAENLLTAFTEMLNSRLNMVAARSAKEFNRSKILINNSFK